MTRMQQRDSKKKSSGKNGLKWIVYSCILFLGIYLAAAGCFEFLIPGNKAVTTAAFSQMVDEVRNGERVDDALMSFCVEILEHAKVSK